MAKQVSTYFKELPIAASTASELATHQAQFPNNKLAVWERTDDKKVVKIAFPNGTGNPGAAPSWMTREEFEQHMVNNPLLYGEL